MDPKSLHIDPHVHCRDWEQSYKATILEVMKTARSQGVIAIVDMPNTNPPIISKEMVEKRLETARKEGCIDGYYLYIGATSDPKQLREAVEVVDTNPKVLGMKMFAGKSVGNLEVSKPEDQRQVYMTLAEIGYKGVLMLHCEKESLFRMDLWNPERPYSWNLARPPEAEIESIRDQISFAKEYGLRAHLHVCHITTPEGVELVNEAKRDLNISCGITPHHLAFSTMNMQRPEDIIYKVNPPVRDPQTMSRLRILLKEDMIDWLETDHAPHSREEKEFAKSKKSDSYMSGIPSLNNYAAFVEGLKKGYGEGQIERFTYSDIKKVLTKIVE